MEEFAGDRNPREGEGCERLQEEYQRGKGLGRRQEPFKKKVGKKNSQTFFKVKAKIPNFQENPASKTITTLSLLMLFITKLEVIPLL